MYKKFYFLSLFLMLLTLFPANQALAQTIEGRIAVLARDSFDKPKLSKELYYLTSEQGNFEVPLEFQEDAENFFGEKVSINYLPSLSTLKDDSLPIPPDPMDDLDWSSIKPISEGQSLRGPDLKTSHASDDRNPDSFGEQRILVILARNSNDGLPSKQETESFYDTLGARFNKHSYGQVSFVTTVVGPVDIPDSVCGFEEMIESSLRAVNDHMEIDLHTFDRIVITHSEMPCSHDDSMSGEAMLTKGIFNSPQGSIEAYWALVKAAYIYKATEHELGHTFGLMHANILSCTTQQNSYGTQLPLSWYCHEWEYGDNYDIMGSGDNDFSAYHKNMIGWLPDSNVIISTGGVFLLSPYGDDPPDNLIQEIRLPINNPNYLFRKEANLYYSLELRASDEEISVQSPDLYNGITIRVVRNSHGYDSRLLKMHESEEGPTDPHHDQLLLGETYHDPMDNYAITLESISSKGAIVRIESTNIELTSHDNFMNLGAVESALFKWHTDSSKIKSYWIGVGSTPESIQASPWGEPLSPGYVGAANESLVRGLPMELDNSAPYPLKEIYLRLWFSIDGNYLYRDYKFYNRLAFDAEPATIFNPSPGATLNESSIEFNWNETGASEYWLSVATTKSLVNHSRGDLFESSMGRNLSAVVHDIPQLGRIIYVRLWSKIGNKWLFKDYQFQTGDKLPRLKAPTEANVLGDSQVTFQWSTEIPVKAYYIGIGTSRHSISSRPWGDIYAEHLGMETSVNVDNIPLKGEDLFVRLWYLYEGKWLYRDYQFRTSAIWFQQ